MESGIFIYHIDENPTWNRNMLTFTATWYNLIKPTIR